MGAEILGRVDLHPEYVDVRVTRRAHGAKGIASRGSRFAPNAEMLQISPKTRRTLNVHTP